MNILYILPKNLLSRGVGALMHVEWSAVLGTRVGRGLEVRLVSAFAKAYQINIDEAEQPLGAYASIGKFFVRKLKPGLRPLGEGPLVHPADSRISQMGILSSGELIQAKGKTYSVESFLQDPGASEIYRGGFFVTYYLCPTDYHRVHSPVSGVIASVTHIPGALWPVNEWSVERIDQLFSVNERVVIEIETEAASKSGRVAVVLVGATNVGKISLSFEPRIVSNSGGSGGGSQSASQPRKLTYSPGLRIKKGDELGIFHMGSTVVVVASQDWFELAGKTQGQAQWQARTAELKGHSVKMGQSLLTI